MTFTDRRARNRGRFGLIWGFLALISPTWAVAADTASGIEFLGVTQSPSGAWEASEYSLNGVISSTTTSLEALGLFEGTSSENQQRAILYLLSEILKVNDHVARSIRALSGSGEDLSAALAQLLAQRLPDGTWGGGEGYASTYLDTALALKALRSAGQTDPDIGGAPVQFLVDGQNADGGWGFVPGEESRVYYTAVVLDTLGSYALQYDVAGAIASAVDYLRTQQNSGGDYGEFGSSTFETALVLLGMLEAGIDFTPAETSALAFIENQQQPDGSWEEDPYSTALALQVLERNIRASLPDLVLANFTVSNPAPPRGSNVTLTAEVCNPGKQAAAGVVTRFYLDNPQAGGTQIGPDAATAEIAPGACVTLSQPFATGGLTGSQNLFVWVDPENTVAEADDTDNLGTLVVQIQPEILNLPPSFTSTPVTTAAADAAYRYLASARDPDGDPVTFALKQAPSGMGIDAKGGLIYWLPRPADVGDVPIEIEASDGRGGVVTQGFTLKVTEANPPPVITSTPVEDAKVLQAYRYQVVATDPENEPLEYFLLQGPSGMHIDRSTGLVRWIPMESQTGVHNVQVQVRDARGAEARQTYAVHIVSAEFGPDLVVAEVDGQAVQMDPDTGAVSGTVAVTIGNAGAQDVTQGFELLLFRDQDGDGVYSTGTDSVLGQETLNGLGSAQTASVDVPVTGSLSFAGDLIYAFVDSADQVTESDEDNNVRHSGQASEFHPKAGALTPKLKWAWTGSDVEPTYDDVIMTPLVVNLTDDNGDGKINEDDIPDVVFVSQFWEPPQTPEDAILRAVSGADGSPIWDATAADERVLPMASIAAADLDGDGLVEIVARSRAPTRLLIFGHDGQLKTAGSYWLGAEWGDMLRATISIVNLDGVGPPEIVLSRAVFNADGTLRFLGSRGFLGTTFNAVGGGILPPSSATTDLDLDGLPELVTGIAAYHSDGSLYYDASSDPILADYFTYGGTGGYTAFGNFNDDPYPEVVVTGSRGVALLDHTGQRLWNLDVGVLGSPTVADFDGDGRPEIGAVNNIAYTVIDDDGSLLWQFSIAEQSSGFTSSSAFDFEGDGAAEVVYADEEYLRVLRGNDGRLLAQIPNPSCTFNESPVVADVDNDGQAEIVVSRNQNCDYGGRTGTLDSGIFVYGDQLGQWVGTRRIWNQHGYYITNVEEDGRVPDQEVPNWSLFSNFRQNEQFSPRQTTTYAAADLTASLLHVQTAGCPSEVQLSARIGNGGAESVPAGIKVSFYDGDPLEGAPLIGTVATSQSLRPGEFEDVSVPFPSPEPGRHRITVSADDGGAPVSIESVNLARLEGTRITDSKGFGNPQLAIDGTPAATGSGDGNHFIEVTFPFPVDVSSLFVNSWTGPWCPLTASLTLSNGFTQSLLVPTCDGAAEAGTSPAIFSPPYPTQSGVTSVRLDFIAGHVYGVELGEVFILGSYADPTGNRGTIAEGQEDNNRASRSFDLCTLVPEVNLPPEIVSSPPTTAVQEIPYQYQVVATDPDGDPRRYSIVEAPPGMTIDPVTGLVRWIPEAADSGVVLVSLEVTDGRGGVARQVYDLSVGPSNLPPIITSAPIDVVAAGEIYSYPVVATDPEQLPLHFYLQSAPPGMGIDADTGLVQWRPLPSQVGSYPVTVAVRDEAGAETLQAFELGVLSPTSGVDLVITRLDNRTATTQPQDLTLGGTLGVTFGNSGDQALSASVDILVFADSNQNGAYDSGVDAVLGSAVHEGGLGALQFVTREIPVSGTIRFRDDLIYAWIDSANAVPEVDEANNLRNTGLERSERTTISGYSAVSGRLFPVDATTRSVLWHGPLVANLTDDNGDGVIDETDTTDIVLAANRYLRAYSSDNGEKLWEVTGSDMPIWSLPAVGDIDGDGLPEIVTMHLDGQRVLIFGGDGSREFTGQSWAPTSLGARSAINIANLDRQGPAEIVIGNVVLNDDGTVRCKGAAGSGKIGDSSISAVVDLDLEGDLEIVAGNVAYRSDCSILWQNTAVPTGLSSVANLDDDPYPEIVLIDVNSQVWILEDDGTVKVGPVTPPAGGGVPGPAVIADFDGDGRPEIGVGAVNFTVFEADLTPRWSVPLLGVPGTASAFDFEGNGRAEVLVSSSGSSRELYNVLDGADGALLYQWEVKAGTIRSRSVYPVPADIDGDNTAEILILTDWGIEALGDRLNRWPGTRPVWNQYAYHVTNVEDDGSIPEQEPDNGALFNNFLQNPSLTLAPDLTASRLAAGQVSCPVSVDLSVRIGNGGGTSAPAGVPVTFFDGSPEEGGVVVGRTTTTVSLSPGDFEDVQVTLTSPIAGLTSFTAMADLATSFENLARLPGVIASSSATSGGLPASRTIDGNLATGVCAVTLPAFVELTFPDPADVNSVTLKRGCIDCNTAFTSGTLQFSNGVELPITLDQNGEGQFTIPLQQDVTSVRFTGSNPGCLGEFIVGGDLTSIPVSSAEQARVDDALVAHWSLDESAGDVSGNGHDGVIGGAPQIIAGATSPGMHLDGQDDHILVSPFADFPTEEITAMFWVRTTDTTRDAGVLSYAVGGTLALPQYWDEFKIQDYRNFRVCHSIGCWETGIGANDGRWHHIAVAWSSRDQFLRLYKDGAPVWSLTMTRGALRGGGNLLIGQDYNLSGAGFQTSEAFLGDLDEVKIYGRALTTSEIALAAGFRNDPGWSEGGRVTEAREDNNRTTLTVDLCSGANRPPVFLSAPVTSAFVGESYQYAATASDPDMDPLSYTLLIAPAGMTVDPGSGVINWSPLFSQVGEHAVAVQVTDGRGGSEVQSYAVTAAERRVDLPPGDTDADGDGFPASADCNDSDPSVNPGAAEIAGNGTDDDCNPATADTVSAAELACAVATDATEYEANQSASVNVQVENLTGTKTFVGVAVSAVIADETGTPVFGRETTVGSLPPNTTRPTVALFDTAQNPAGTYTARVDLSYGGTAAAHCETPFAIVATGVTVLQGQVTVTPATVNERESTAIAYEVTNPGNADVASAELRIDITDAFNGTVTAQLTDTATVPAGAAYQGSQFFAGDARSAGEYLAVLSTVTPPRVLGAARFSILAVNEPPIAEAGPLQTVDEGTTVTLDASASSDPDGDAIAYHWLQTSGPPVALSDPRAAQPVFTAPDVGRSGAALTFALTVGDGQLEATDTVSVNVQFVNQAPVADAGPDQPVDELTTVVLDGSASADPDADALSYEWAQVAGLQVELNTSDPVHPTFVAPDVPPDGATLTFELVVSDGEVASDPDAVNITVKDVNHPPVADAGPDQAVHEDQPVTLDGSASFDPDADPITYMWVQSVGPLVDLADADSALPSFIAPMVGTGGVLLTFELTVDDGSAEATDTVNVLVEEVNHPPTSNAGPDQTVDEGVLVTLDGGGSNDPDGDVLLFDWVQVDGTPVELADADTATPSFVAPIAASGGGQLVFALTVSDGELLSEPDQMVVTVLSADDPPVCALAEPSALVLWPPNHKMEQIRILGVSDPIGDHVTLTVMSVTQDEATDGLGDGDTSPDAVLQGDSVLLRSERSGTGDGRTYQVEFRAVDDIGQYCEGQVVVCVPHAKGRACVDSGERYDATLP